MDSKGRSLIQEGIVRRISSDGTARVRIRARTDNEVRWRRVGGRRGSPVVRANDAQDQTAAAERLQCPTSTDGPTFRIAVIGVYGPLLSRTGHAR